ncbi:hypothetical protein SFC50_02270 [Bacillus infantis]|uniref:hypothetical protein n=1 Tax=Bacillus infantis TaxID=324767 RepID=UPI00301B2C8D
MQFILNLETGLWQTTKKTDAACVALADRHYSRLTVGASQFTRPGENLVFRTADGTALWVTWRSRFERKDGYGRAWECTIFRNESGLTSSLLIKEAIHKTIELWGPLPSDGMITYVSPTKVKSENPGYSFQRAGFKRLSRRSTKGLFVYRITQERFERAKSTDILVEEITYSLEILEEAFLTEDSEWYSILEDIAGRLKQLNREVLELRKLKNYGYQDFLFRLEHFFHMYGELDPELNDYYWSLKWN